MPKSPNTGALPKKKHNYNITRSQLPLIITFVGIWVIGFLVFSLYPIISTAYHSFTEYNSFSPAVFNGLTNYKTMFKDPLFYKTILNTVYYIILGVGLNIALSLAIAVLLNSKVKCRGLLRAVFFLPSVMPAVATTVLWVWLLNPQYGLIDAALRFLHLPIPLWFYDPHWTKPALIMMILWGCGSTMVIFLAGVGNISKSYYEAVDIDGGGPLAKFWNITRPMISPIMLFQIINGIIAGFSVFTQTYIASSMASGGAPSIGGPSNSMLFFAPYIYEQAFSFSDFGYSCALAFFMFLLVLIVTVIIFSTSRYWVYYEGA